MKTITIIIHGDGNHLSIGEKKVKNLPEEKNSIPNSNKYIVLKKIIDSVIKFGIISLLKLFYDYLG